MPRLIDADALKSYLYKQPRCYVKSKDGDWKNEGYTCDDVFFAIDKQPTAVLEEPKADWFTPVPGDGEPCCTRCRKPPMYDYAYGIIGGWKLTQYCPNCGAKMYKKG